MRAANNGNAVIVAMQGAAFVRRQALRHASVGVTNATIQNNQINRA